jgi:hypothetical protein
VLSPGVHCPRVRGREEGGEGVIETGRYNGARDRE